MTATAAVISHNVPRVLIVGTRPQQRQFIVRQFDGRCTVDYFDDPHSTKNVAHKARFYDFVVLNTQLARHNHMYGLRAIKANFVMTKGASTQIVQAIQEYLTTCKP